MSSYTLLYFTKGSGTLLIDFKPYKFEKYSLVLLSIHQLLDFKFEENETDGFCIELSPKFFTTISKTTNSYNLNYCFNYWIYTNKIKSEQENFYGNILNLYKEIKQSTSSVDQLIIQKIIIGIFLKIERQIQHESTKKIYNPIQRFLKHY